MKTLKAMLNIKVFVKKDSQSDGWTNTTDYRDP